MFRVLESRNDAWRVRFDVSPFRVPPGTNFKGWREEEVTAWAHSIKMQYGLKPGTVAKVCCGSKIRVGL